VKKRDKAALRVMMIIWLVIREGWVVVTVKGRMGRLGLAGLNGFTQ